MFLLRKTSLASLAIRNHTWIYKQPIISRSVPVCYSSETNKTAAEANKVEDLEGDAPPIDVKRYTTQEFGEVVKIKNDAVLDKKNVDAMERVVVDALFAKEETSVSFDERLGNYCDYLSSKYTVMYKLKEYENIINHFLNDLVVCTDSILATVLKAFIKLEIYPQAPKVLRVLEISNAIPQNWYRTQTVATQIYARNLYWDKSMQLFQNLLQNKQLNESLAKFMVQKLQKENEKDRVTQVISSLVDNNFSMKADLATLCKEAVADNADLVSKISSK